MRYLAVGDIHGCFTALTTLADFVPLAADDVLITLGDYVDRGPQAFAVLDWLIAYSRRARLLPLRGNHGIMTLRAPDNQLSLPAWLGYGGTWTPASRSHFADAYVLADVRDDHSALHGHPQLPY